jgi:hypothetical protein
VDNDRVSKGRRVKVAVTIEKYSHLEATSLLNEKSSQL